jgi:hypothetical protein
VHQGAGGKTLARPLDEATRTHLADSAESLRQSLAAKLPRAGI